MVCVARALSPAWVAEGKIPWALPGSVDQGQRQSYSLLRRLGATKSKAKAAGGGARATPTPPHGQWPSYSGWPA